MGIKLSEEVEKRQFYLSCLECDNYNLDFGFDKDITCWKCNNIYEAESRADEMKVDKTITKEEREHLSHIDNYIKELSDLVLIINKDSIENYDFFFNENSNINYYVIIQKILLPFFKIKLRIFKEGLYFKIGDIEFKVSGLSPDKYGFVSSNTYVRLDK